MKFGHPSTSSTTTLPASGHPSTSSTTTLPVSGHPSTSSTTTLPASGHPSTSSTTTLPASGHPSTSSTTTLPASGHPSTSSTTTSPASGHPSTSSTPTLPASGHPSTNRFLQFLIKEHFPPGKARQLGVFLDVPQERLHTFAVNNPNNADGVLMDVITYWIDNDRDREASWDRLATALEECGHAVMAKKIQSKSKE